MTRLISLLVILCSKSAFINLSRINSKANRVQIDLRCMRRFTPGVCAEQVAVVWTYSLQVQNCTQRMGCRSSGRTNRFESYAHCISRCQHVGELYEQLLEDDMSNGTDLEREGLQDVKTGRRKGSIGSINNMEVMDNEKFNEKENLVGETQ
ncbi:hypothetical protein ACJJTC_005052 [Scirpophaga incertulas]